MARRRRSSHRWDDEFDEDEAPAPRSAEVDLHGCTIETALRRVSEALARCRAAGRSPLVVITGRGSGSFAGNAVLQPEVKRWLAGPEARGLGAADVRLVNGGGALEVTVRRRGRA